MCIFQLYVALYRDKIVEHKVESGSDTIVIHFFI